MRFDCHAHIYETINPILGARYTPVRAAPLTAWSQHLRAQGFKGGVIVQVSFLGTDNTELCAALAQLNHNRFAGVAVVPTSVNDDEIDRLYSSGVRGFRWNLVRGSTLPDLQKKQVRHFLEKIQQRNMHIELHLESPYLATLINPLLDTGCTVAVDHLGLPSEPEPENDPWICAIRQRDDLSGLYVKFSAPYRTVFDTRPHALALQSLLSPDHIVWGSDWPHTQHESIVGFDAMVDWGKGFLFRGESRAVEALYGISHGES